MSAHFPLLLPPLQLAYILRNLHTPFAAPHQLTAYRISTLESCVVHHFSVGFLQTILLYSFFFHHPQHLVDFLHFPQLPTIIFSCFVLLKFCRGGTSVGEYHSFCGVYRHLLPFYDDISRVDFINILLFVSLIFVELDAPIVFLAIFSMAGAIIK